MVSPDEVSAVLVTRGDVDMEPVVDSILTAGITQVVLWDNAIRDDMQVFGRYAALHLILWKHGVKGDVIYTQDDDCVVPIPELLDAYDDDELLVNVPAGEKPWLAWGALFTWQAWRHALEAYLRAGGIRQGDRYPPEMMRWPDVVFASLTDWRAIDLGHIDLPHAFAANRMYQQPDHYTSQEEVERKCVAIGGKVRRA